MRSGFFSRSAVVLLTCMLASCAALRPGDPLQVDVIDIEPLTGGDLELRMAVKMRIQNPNERAVSFDGVALRLEVNHQPLASGVSDQRGEIGRFSETVVTVPISVTAFSMLRQAYGLGQLRPLQGLPYTVRGKLASGWLGTTRFEDTGTLNLEPPTTGTR